MEEKLDMEDIKTYFKSKGHEVSLISNFCDEIKKESFQSPFSRPERPTVFAGCSPLVMENRIKVIFKVPVEIANIREQCAWANANSEIINIKCREIISQAIERVKFSKPFSFSKDNFCRKISGYLSEIEKIGPNPFKM